MPAELQPNFATRGTGSEEKRLFIAVHMLHPFGAEDYAKLHEMYFQICIKQA